MSLLRTIFGTSDDFVARSHAELDAMERSRNPKLQRKALDIWARTATMDAKKDKRVKALKDRAAKLKGQIPGSDVFHSNAPKHDAPPKRPAASASAEPAAAAAPAPRPPQRSLTDRVLDRINVAFSDEPVIDARAQRLVHASTAEQLSQIERALDRFTDALRDALRSNTPFEKPERCNELDRTLRGIVEECGCDECSTKHIDLRNKLALFSASEAAQRAHFAWEARQRAAAAPLAAAPAQTLITPIVERPPEVQAMLDEMAGLIDDVHTIDMTLDALNQVRSST